MAEKRPIYSVVHYEIYTLEGKRWILHARYRKDEREIALLEAKNFEQVGQGTPVKLVREAYDPQTNQFEENIIYKSSQVVIDRYQLRERERMASTPRRGGGGGSIPAGLDAFADLDRPAQRRGGSSATANLGMAGKAIVHLLISFVLAAVVTIAFFLLIRFIPNMRMLLGGADPGAILFLIFIITFALAAIPRFIALARMAPTPSGKSAQRTSAASAPIFASPSEDSQALAQAAQMDAAAESPDLLPLEAPPAEIPPQTDLAAEAEPPSELEAPVSDAMEAHRLIMIRFLESTLSAIKGNVPQLDAYNRFGLFLLLGGGAEFYAAARGLSNADRGQLLRATLQVLGAGSGGQAFAERYEEHIAEPRYRQMAQSGRDAMNRFLGGDNASLGPLLEAFEFWNRKTSGNDLMSVMFTDIVGSTDYTQTRGDWAAQDMVRRHNAIVRTAITEHDGKEIKHTGDGIMASFPNAYNAVRSAIHIQREVLKHNTANPEQSLHMRLGINAGEPVKDEDDLFGTTVQLAARVCAKADSDQIYCSSVITELNAGKGLVFLNRGTHELKGFKQQIPLFEIRWWEPDRGEKPPPSTQKYEAAQAASAALAVPMESPPAPPEDSPPPAASNPA